MKTRILLISVNDVKQNQILNSKFFYRTIPPLTYKHISNSLTKKGEMGSSHVNLALNTQSRLVGAMSNININTFLPVRPI